MGNGNMQTITRRHGYHYMCLSKEELITFKETFKDDPKTLKKIAYGGGTGILSCVKGFPFWGSYVLVGLGFTLTMIDQLDFNYEVMYDGLTEAIEKLNNDDFCILEIEVELKSRLSQFVKGKADIEYMSIINSWAMPRRITDEELEEVFGYSPDYIN